MKKNIFTFAVLISIFGTNHLFSGQTNTNMAPIDPMPPAQPTGMMEPGLAMRDTLPMQQPNDTETAIHTTTRVGTLKLDTDIIEIKSLNNKFTGTYNPELRKAVLIDGNNKLEYTKVVEHSVGAPPRSNNPEFKPFATIPNPHYKPGLIGQPQNITLYGVELGHQKTFSITGLNGETGTYNPDTKTADLLDEQGKHVIYTDVVEHQAPFAPVTNPKLQKFATMINPHISNSRMMGQSKKIELYGMPQNLKTILPTASDIHRTKSNWTFITGMNGNIGFYDPTSKTAYLLTKVMYTDVIEHSKATTPPNVENHQLQPFATMYNPEYTESASEILGAPTEKTTLYGIEQNESK